MELIPGYVAIERQLELIFTEKLKHCTLRNIQDVLLHAVFFVVPLD